MRSISLSSLEQVTARMRINVDVVRIVVVIISKVKIESLISGNECLQVHFVLGVRAS